MLEITAFKIFVKGSSHFFKANFLLNLDKMASSEGGGSSKISDFKARLAKLHSKRNEAARLNHQEVVEEDKLKKMPKNHIKKRERLEMELHEEEEKAAAEREFISCDFIIFMAEEYGKDYNRQKMLSVSAVDAERQYDRLIKGVKVDLEDYEKEKAAVGEQAFYREDNTICIGLHKDAPDAIDNMVKDLENQNSGLQTIVQCTSGWMVESFRFKLFTIETQYSIEVENYPKSLSWVLVLI
ncbi:Pre-mRNA-splicing factor Syf2, partial [Armadillidium vulgare]